MDLSSKKCVPCEVKIPPFSAEKIKDYLRHLKLGWEIVDGKKLRHEFRFKDFTAAMVFVNQMAAIAEAEGHHPDISIFYNKVAVTLWTHFIGGLHENDFILAAKIEQLV